MNLEIAKRILGLHYAVTQDELKTLYRKLAIDLHPDMNKSPRAKEQFQELQQAYVLIKKNLPLLPSKPKPKPKGEHIHCIFKKGEPLVVYLPEESLITEDVVVNYMMPRGSMGSFVIPLGTKIPTMARLPCGLVFRIERGPAPTGPSFRPNRSQPSYSS